MDLPVTGPPIQFTPQFGFQFDPLSAEFAQDPYPVYAAMRDHGEPVYYAGEGTWMLTRISDVEAAALDKTMLRVIDDRFSAAERRALQVQAGMHDMPYHERYVQTNMLDSEGEAHDRQRKLVFREFTPVLVERQRPMIEAHVDALLDDIADKREIDFVGDFAAHIPGHVIGRVIGVPDQDCPQLRIWSEDVVRYYNVGRTEDQKQAAETAVRDFCDYLTELIDTRIRHPRNDLLTRLIACEQDGEVSRDETISLAMLILMAGHGSTIDVLGSGLHALLRFPDEHLKLRENPGLMRSTVQEMFRFESPLPYFHRFATKDITVAGQAFEAGTRFGLLYGAANRDPDRFTDPDRFDIARRPNRHIAFGGGVHFCLGNHLSRLDMMVVFAALNTRFGSIELVEEPIYKRGLSVRGPEALKIAVQAA